MNLLHSTHQARIKTFCPIEGELFWRATRYIGQAPVIQESLIKQFPHVKDIESIIASQKKGRYAYVKFTINPLPDHKRYLAELRGYEPRVSILSASEAASSLAKEGSAVQQTLVAIVDQPRVHVEFSLAGRSGLTPNYLFEKLCKKIIPPPRFATMRDADQYDRDVLERLEEIVSHSYQAPLSDLPLDSAFVGFPFANTTVEVRELNPRFAENPMVEQIASGATARQPSTGFSTIGLSDLQRAHLRMEQRMVDLNKKWRRYHQTSNLPGERLRIGNGFDDWFTAPQHFWDGPITMPHTVRPTLEVTYEFYPYIEDEFGYLRNMQKSLEYMALMGTTDHWNFMNKTNNAQVAAFINQILTTGLTPGTNVSAVDVVVNYLNARSPAILHPHESGRLLFGSRRMDPSDVFVSPPIDPNVEEFEDDGPQTNAFPPEQPPPPQSAKKKRKRSPFDSDGFLVVRQNGELTDIIYILSLKLTFFYATQKSPTGRYAVLSESLFGPGSNNGQPNFVINTWRGESEEHPHRPREKFLIFSVENDATGKMFEDAEKIDETQTPLIAISDGSRVDNLKSMSPIASLASMRRRECYSNAIQFGTGDSPTATEVLYGTVMARGLLDIKVYLLVEEHNPS